MNENIEQQTLTPEQAAFLEKQAAELRSLEEAGQNPLQVQQTTPEPTDASMGRRILRDVGRGITEAPGQIVRGAAEGLDAAADGLRSIFVSREDRQANPTSRVADSIGIGKAESVTGGIVNDIAQFAVGFLGASRILRGFGMAQGITRGMVAGAVTDASVFNAHEERLSNLVEQYPNLSNPITRYLAADQNDGEAEGRFKNALEGLIIGGAVDGLISSVKAIRAARRGNLDEAAAEAEKAGKSAPPERDPLADPEAARKMDEEAQAELNLEGGRMNASSADPPQVIRDNPTGDPSATKAPTYEPQVLVDEKALDDITRQYISEAGFGQDRNLSGIRTDLIETNLDANQMLSAIRISLQKQMDAVDPAGPVGRVQTLDDVRKQAADIAHDVGGDADLLFQRLAGRAENDVALAAEVTAYRIFLTSIGDNTAMYAKALGDTTGRAAEAMGGRAAVAEQYRKHVELLANTAALYRGVQTNIARALNSMRLQVKSSADMMQGLHDIEAHAARFLMAGNTSAQVRAVENGWAKRATSALNEYYINSILSGPKTQAVAALSNIATTVLQPAERMIAGALHGGARNEFIEGGLQYVALATNLKDSVVLAARALKQGDPILDPFRSTVEIQGQAAIGSKALGMNGGIAAGTVDLLGNVVRLPSRLLMTQDEFFKQLTYRSRITAGAWREAMASGLSPGSKEFAEIVQKRMDGAFDSGDRAVHTDALEAARAVTFTDDLKAQTWGGGQTFGETLQKATGNHPFLQLILPFVRTPTNVARWFWDRTPGLNQLRAQHFNDFWGKNGPEAQARARAQNVVGGALWGSAIVAAAEGDITGGGPSDPTIRRMLQATGWQPYSIRTTNEDGSVSYRGYNRFDPFGLFFSIAADLTETAGFLQERELDQVASDMTTALARQLQNKTYLSGLMRALGGLAEPDRRGAAFVEGLAGGFVPSVVSQTMRDDPFMREVRGIMDALKARTPGSIEMDPVRNVLGEVVATPPAWGPDWISPIAETKRPGGDQPMTREWRFTIQDRVHDEIARQLVIHNAALRQPTPKLYGEVDLREWQHPETGRTAYDRYQTLVGEVELDGVNLRDRLQETIRSPEYREVATDGSFDHDGSRIDLIRRVIGYYRQAAEAKLRDEMPELAAALDTARTRQAFIRVQ